MTDAQPSLVACSTRLVLNASTRLTAASSSSRCQDFVNMLVTMLGSGVKDVTVGAANAVTAFIEVRASGIGAMGFVGWGSGGRVAQGRNGCGRGRANGGGEERMPYHPSTAPPTHACAAACRYAPKLHTCTR